MNVITILQIAIMVILFIIIIIAIRQNNTLKKEKRIGKYSLEPLNNNYSSALDKLFDNYSNVVRKIRPIIKKIKYFERRANTYEKYIKYRDKENVEKIDYIIHKIFISFSFLVLTIVSQVFALQVLTLPELIINYFIGYYLLDIYLYFNYKRQTKLIENELLRSVIVMNNAFKAGKSTLQAVEIASIELPEPISDEFKKIYLDMKYGLSIDTAFDRFAKRVNIEEATYLSSSLIILSKTGGNIVEVFSSIERTLFDKRKLKEELKNLTSSSNMILKILFAVPFIFIFIIYILNPTYFNPLFNSPLGYMVLLIILIMFIIYIWILNKILKVKV